MQAYYTIYMKGRQKMAGRTKRDSMKRKMAQAVNNLDSVMLDVLYLKQLFEVQHPDLAEELENIAQIALMLQQGIESFSFRVWGTPPDKLGKFR